MSVPKITDRVVILTSPHLYTNDRHSSKYSSVVKVVTNTSGLGKNEELNKRRFMQVIDNSLIFYMNYG